MLPEWDSNNILQTVPWELFSLRIKSQPILCSSLHGSQVRSFIAQRVPFLSLGCCTWRDCTRCTPPITTANQSPGSLAEVLSPSCDSGLWVTGGEGDGPGQDWVWGWVFLVVWVWWWWWCVVVKVTWPGEAVLSTASWRQWTVLVLPPPNHHPADTPASTYNTSITSHTPQDRLLSPGGAGSSP